MQTLRVPRAPSEKLLPRAVFFRALIAKTGMKRKPFLEAIGADSTNVYRWEVGTTEEPRGNNARMIVDGFRAHGIEVTWDELQAGRFLRRGDKAAPDDHNAANRQLIADYIADGANEVTPDEADELYSLALFKGPITRSMIRSWHLGMRDRADMARERIERGRREAEARGGKPLQRKKR